jgi:hypothetical protein
MVSASPLPKLDYSKFNNCGFEQVFISTNPALLNSRTNAAISSLLISSKTDWAKTACQKGVLID